MRVLRALLVLTLSATSLEVIAAPGQATPSSISGTASDATGGVLSNAAVQLRSVSTARLVGRGTTNGLGQFSFGGLTPGTYVIEVLNSSGQIVGTSAAVIVSADATVIGASVTASSGTKIAGSRAGGQTMSSSASLSGNASDATGGRLSNAAVQLRNALTAQLVDHSTTNGLGQFSFGGLTPGTYVIEVLNSSGQIVGASAAVIVSAAATVIGASVTASSGTKIADAGAGFSGRTAALMLGAAAAAGVAGGVAMASGGTASPSR
jgi:large repetitive protein